MIALNESIEIRAAPQKVFDWFRHLDENYVVWHRDHVKWTFEGGLREGGRCEYEEMLHGDLHRVNAVLTRVVDDRLIKFRNTFPMSLLCPRGSFAFEPIGDGTLFTATLEFRAGKFFLTLAKRRVDAVKHHMKEESQNLKQILEGVEGGPAQHPVQEHAITKH